MKFLIKRKKSKLKSTKTQNKQVHIMPRKEAIDRPVCLVRLLRKIN